MGKTNIEWCEHSVNPIRARLKDTCSVGHYCEKTSPGCSACYASAFQPRFHMPEFQEQRSNEAIECFLDTSKLEEVLKRKVPTRYFWCSMSDLFGRWVETDWIMQCFQAMMATPQHVHMLLTKRPETVVVLDEELPWRPWIWLGTSVENDKYMWRIAALQQTSAYVKFLSLEPLLGPLPCLDLTGINLVIVGGESGPGARPMHADWVRDIRDQCLEAGAKMFFKQWGGVHKKAAGRLLDGREWNELPSLPRGVSQLALFG
jgi:protein gp37